MNPPTTLLSFPVEKNLVRAIEFAKSWRLVPDSDPANPEYCAGNLWRRSDPLSGRYAASEFAVLHPDFPRLLAHLQATPEADAWTTGPAVKSSWQLWQSTLTMPNSTRFGQHPGDVVHVHKIKSMWHEPQYQHLSLELFLYLTARTEDGLLYATDIDYGRPSLPYSYWDSHYPQWRERLEIATGLGLSSVESIAYLFQEPATPSLAPCDNHV